MKKILFYCLLCIGVCVGCESTEEEFVGQKTNSNTQKYPPLEDVDLFVYTETFDTLQIYNDSPSTFGYTHQFGNYRCNMLDLKIDRWSGVRGEPVECPTYAFYFLSPQHDGKRFPAGIYSQNAPANTPWCIGKACKRIYLYDDNNMSLMMEELLSQCCIQITREGDEEHIKIWMEFENSEPAYRYVEFIDKIDLTLNTAGSNYSCGWYRECFL